jgi:hypothetical protein
MYQKVREDEVSPILKVKIVTLLKDIKSQKKNLRLLNSSINHFH